MCSLPEEFAAIIHFPSRQIRLPGLVLLAQFCVSTTCFAETSLLANELGRVPIFEYHLIESQESRWSRSIENFKADLELLYQSGYRPISLSDYLDGRIDVPAGKKPFILTFDDSSPGQFRYLVRDGKNVIDPDCAVGMLLEFHREHSDFPLKAIFFVLPEARQPHKLFGQPEFEAGKLLELVRLGFEIGNHTLWHANLGKYDGEVVQKQLAQAQEAIRKYVPGYTMRALALPLGVFPKDPQLARAGSYRGHAYHHEAILLVAGPPAPSPFSTACDLYHLPRIQVPGSDFRYWLNYFEKHPGEVFVSDGKPAVITFPHGLRPRFNASKFPRFAITAY